MSPYEKAFEAAAKSADRTFRFAIAIQAILVLAWLTAIAGFIYVAAHFISKFW